MTGEAAPFKVAIPARYGSTRLPGKPLRELAGKPMVQHVYARAVESGAAEVVVATDDERIAAAVRAFGGDACMTSADHPTGTDRIAEVAATRRWAPDALVVNLQGDEPRMPGALVRQVAQDLARRPDAVAATLCTPIRHAKDLFDPAVVKVVTDRDGYALYFSRAPIPWVRDAFAQSTERLPPGVTFLHHYGIYAYRAGFLQEYVRRERCPPEQAEALEQLRVLWAGERIFVRETPVTPGHGVDTEEDLQRVGRDWDG